MKNKVKIHFKTISWVDIQRSAVNHDPIVTFLTKNHNNEKAACAS